MLVVLVSGGGDVELMLLLMPLKLMMMVSFPLFTQGLWSPSTHHHLEEGGYPEDTEKGRLGGQEGGPGEGGGGGHEMRGGRKTKGVWCAGGRVG